MLAITGPMIISTPQANSATGRYMEDPSATAAMSVTPARPATMASTAPMPTMERLTTSTGRASGISFFISFKFHVLFISFFPSMHSSFREPEHAGKQAGPERQAPTRLQG